MEIRLGWPGRPAVPLVVTMRTPGADFELAVGFLYAEGIVRETSQVRRVAYCTAPDVGVDQRYNTVSVELTGPPDGSVAQRFGSISSACGVCGKQSLDELALRGATRVGPGPSIDGALLTALPDRLRAAQRVFDRTGGLHAAGLFDTAGEPQCVREDVGRHNAVDKVLGWAVVRDRVPLSESILVVSGRAGFEICQKAVAAGVPLVTAVGAPSSLAVEVAEQFGVTLVGFVRNSRYVIYSEPARVRDGELGPPVSNLRSAEA